MVTIKRKPDFKIDHYENTAWADSDVICGIDEVGRGCLAGPVVTAAVILHAHKKSPLLKDSKILSPDRRLKSYNWIIKNSWYATGIIHHRQIDSVNIYQATLRAMKRALVQLLATAPVQPHLVLVDAMPLQMDSFPGDIIYFNYGESKSSSIAAASIIAKVTRDRIMQQLDSTFTHYRFAQHKGYSTALHKEKIAQYGSSILHRVSFTDHLAGGESPIQEPFELHEHE